MIGVMPLLLRPSQRGFQGVLVPNAGQAPMFPDLVVMDGIDDDTSQPPGLTTPGHRLLRQFSERIPILLGRFCGQSQCPFGFGVVGREENAPVCLHREHAVAGLEPSGVVSYRR